MNKNLEISIIEDNYKEILQLKDKIIQLRDENYNLFLTAELWHPIEELNNIEPGKYFSIDIIVVDKDGSKRMETLCGEILEITKNHKLYYSDFQEGIIEFDNEIDKYIHAFFGDIESINIIGFCNLLKTCKDQDEITLF